MYKKSRTITECVSNNCLNWDERVNHSIVVPSLINGSLDDVQIGTETAIECDVDGRLVAGKGLKNFIFLDNARVPTWIMDNHNHAFAFWHDALGKGWIENGSLLIHIDQHTDLATPSEMPKSRQSTKDKVQNNGSCSSSSDEQNHCVAGLSEDPGIQKNKLSQSEQNKESNNGLDTDSIPHSGISLKPEYDGDNFLNEIEEYTNTILTIADFIVPALATGLLSEAVMVTGEDMQTSRSYVWENKKEERINNKEGNLIKKSTQLGTVKDKRETRQSLIVDIDLDYFSQGFDDAKTLETTKYWIEKADIITIATSPLFIDQDEAMRILRNLHAHIRRQ